MQIERVLFLLSLLIYLIIFLFYLFHSPNKLNNELTASEKVFLNQTEVPLDSTKLRPFTENAGKSRDSVSKSVENTAPIFQDFFGTQELTSSLIINPFVLLGSYPPITREYQEIRYKSPNYGIKNEQDYCQRVDLYNLAQPDNIFKRKNFWTDFPNNQLPSNMVMNKIGKTLQAPRSNQELPLNITINNFFVQFGSFHYYHETGSNFLCATQMYNQIPGQGTLTSKDKFVDSINKYIERYSDHPRCFNESSIYPYTYRLYNINECKAFFKKINSSEYKESLSREAIQYVIKVGVGVHKSEGVFLFDQAETEKLNKEYNFGAKCGEIERSLLAQTYISNPLLLDMDNKFDFRIYMLIASTNPLIVYYHDGFLKLSLNAYQKNSSDRATHLTNTFLANQKINGLKDKNATINGLTKEQLEEYILWDFEKFQSYLLQSGKINDTNWLDNYLRPAFHKALVHLVRATKHGFWNQSNVYGLHGVDFVIDDKMQLWFIESNASPLLSGTKKYMVYHSVLMSLFEIQYAYFRSRMKRSLAVIGRMQQEIQKNQVLNITKWQGEYQKAMKNRLEPEYKISVDNNFTLIMDENLKGSKAYFGYISDECLH